MMAPSLEQDRGGYVAASLFFSLVKFMWFLLFHFLLFCEKYIISLITTRGKGTEPSPSPASVGWSLAGRMVDADGKQPHQVRQEHDAHRR
jgi:hypothetical protein